MKTNPIRILTSYHTTIILLMVYAVIMAAATIVEKFYGTPVTKAIFYYSPLFFFLQFLMIANFVGITITHKFINQKKWSYMAIHASLIVILCGAMTTHVTGEEGLLHIREGERSNEMVVKESNNHRIQYLPFEVELTDFKLTRYPGSQSPSSYESYLKLHSGDHVQNVKVYMNNVLDFKGYRFYQASYDPDEGGTILSVNHDSFGRTITYCGYSLLFLGLALMFFDKDSRFHRLWRMLNSRYIYTCILFISLCGTSQAKDYLIPSAHAKQFGELPMQSNNGRIIPINTFASEIIRKFNAQKLIGDKTPEQVILSIYAFPADWSVIPIIEVKDKEIAEQMGWKSSRIAYRDAFDKHGFYKLSTLIEQIYGKNPAERTRHDKEILKIDDRINILHELINRRLVRIFPDSKDTINYRWYSIGELAATDSISEIAVLSQRYLSAIQKGYVSGDWKDADESLQAIATYQTTNERGNHISPIHLKVEVLYNKLDLLRYCKIGYLILGGFMLVLSFIKTDNSKKCWSNDLFKLLTISVVIFFLLHTLSLGMRWFISGYAPWSNSYETMVSLGWAGVLCGFIFVRRNHLVGALATLFGGVILFVSSLNWMDPQITPLVPVLKSPWLMAHVATLVMAYGCLGISCMIGTAYLLVTVSKNPRMPQLLAQLSIINEISMLAGTALLTVGIFLGAIWANESWGRYWSWDPKETWALITMIVYAGILHTKWMLHCTNRTFNWLSQWAILSIVMTFLGVNYFLSGMHSYGSHDALSGIPIWAYLLFLIFFIVPITVSYIFGKTDEEEIS